MKRYLLITLATCFALLYGGGGNFAWAETIVETYDFDSWGKNHMNKNTYATMGTTAAGFKVNSVDMNRLSITSDKDSEIWDLSSRFAVSSNVTFRWGSGKNDIPRLGNEAQSGVRYISITQLKAGDQFVITGSNVVFYSSNVTYDDGGTPTAVVGGTTGVVSGTTYTVTGEGLQNVDFTIASRAWGSITKVVVTRKVLCAEPTFSITGASGNSRKFQLTSATDGATIFYSDSEIAIDSPGWTEYTGEVTSEATTIWAYASKDGNKSSIINFTTGAGTTIKLNAPVISKTAFSKGNYTVSLSSNQSNLSFVPNDNNVHYKYSIDNGATVEGTTATLPIGSAITAWVECDGYSSSDQVTSAVALERPALPSDWEQDYREAVETSDGNGAQAIVLNATADFTVGGTDFYNIKGYGSKELDLNKNVGLNTATYFFLRRNGKNSGILMNSGSGRMIGLKNLKTDQIILIETSGTAITVNSGAEFLEGMSTTNAFYFKATATEASFNYPAGTYNYVYKISTLLPEADCAKYTVTAKSNDGKLNKVIESGLENPAAGRSLTIPFNKYIKVGGTLYEAKPIDNEGKAYSTTFTVDAEKNIDITYAPTDIKNVVFLSEGEDIVDPAYHVTAGTINDNGSGRKAAATDGNNLTEIKPEPTITTLEPGNYRIIACYGGKAGQAFKVKVGGEAKIDVLSKYAPTEHMSDAIDLSSTADVTFTGGYVTTNGSNAHGLDYIYIKNLGAKISYKVNAVDKDGNVLQNLSVDYGYENEPKKVAAPYSKYVNVNGTLYEAKPNKDKAYLTEEFTVAGKDTVVNIVYEKTNINHVTYLSEAEDIANASPYDKANANIRCSNGQGAFFEGNVPATSLMPGNYRIIGQIFGGDPADDTKNSTFTISINNETIWSQRTTGSLTEHCDTFTISAPSAVIVNEGGKGVNGKGVALLDYLYIQTLGDEGSFQLKAASEDGAIDALLATRTGYANDEAKYAYYPKYITADGVLYEAQPNEDGAYRVLYTIDGNTTQTIAYTKTDIENVVYLSEAEDIEGMTESSKNNADVRCSNGKGAFAAEAPVKLTNLPAGNYKIGGAVWGAKDETFAITAGNDSVWTATTTGSIVNNETQFELSEATDLMIAKAGDGSSNAKLLDYVYIQYLGATINYSVKAVSEDGAIDSLLAQGTAIESEDIINVAYPKYIKVDSVLYEAQASRDGGKYCTEITLNESVEATVAYTKTDIEKVVFLTEAEAIEGVTAVDEETCSDGKGAYAAEAVALTSLKAGYYKMAGALRGAEGTEFAVTVGNDTIWAAVTIADETAFAETEFELTEDATLTIAAAGDENALMDYFYIQVAEKQVEPEPEPEPEPDDYIDFTKSEGAKSTDENPEAGIVNDPMTLSGGSQIEAAEESALNLWDNEDGTELRVAEGMSFYVTPPAGEKALHKIIIKGKALNLKASNGTLTEGEEETPEVEFETPQLLTEESAQARMANTTDVDEDPVDETEGEAEENAEETLVWTGNINKVKFTAEADTRISSIIVESEDADENTETYTEPEPQPEDELLTDAKTLLGDSTGVAAGKLIAAIDAYEQVEEKQDADKEALAAAMAQYENDNAAQENDQTAKVKTDGWKKYDGSKAGVCATQYAPAIDTYDGRKGVQLAEVYESTVATTGTIIYQDITGLQNGTYKVGFYGNAFFTSGRGFDSDMADGAEDVAYVFANDQKEFIVSNIATETKENNFRTFNVNVTDGAIKLGMGKEKPGTNWHTMQIYQLTWMASAKDVYANDLAALKAAIAVAKENQADELKTEGKEALAAAIEAAEAAAESNMLNISELEAEVGKLAQAINDFQTANLVTFEGKYYIQHVASGKFMAAGHNWGTRGIVNAEGLDLTLTADDNKKVTIDSRVANNETNHFLGSGLYMDAGAFGWTIEKLSDDSYAIGDGTKYLTIDADDNLTLADEGASWKFVAAETLEAERLAANMATLAAATKDNGVDATFLIKTPQFNRNDQRNTDNWTVSEDCTNKNLGGGSNDTQFNGCAESYHSTFTISQLVAGAPKGTYRMTAQGFYRQDGETTEATPLFFMNDATAEVPAKTGSENSMADAGTSFSAGEYTIEPIEVFVDENGTLTVGIKNETAASQWIIFDNFRLTYFGEEDSTTPKLPTYTVNEVIDGQVVRTTEGQAELGATVKVPYRHYNVVDGKLYSKGATSKEYNYSFTFNEDGQTETISGYSATDIEGVVFLSEGEDIKGLTVNNTGNTAVRSSNSASAYAAEEDVEITKLPAGTYKLTAAIYDSAKNPNSMWYFIAGNDTIAKLNCTAVNYQEKCSEKFTLEAETSIKLAKGGSSTQGIDLVYIQAVEAETPIFSYTVNEVIGETVVRTTEGTDEKGATVKVPFREYNMADGKLYKKGQISKEFNYSFKLNSDAQVENLEYSATSVENVVFLKEGEDIEGLTKINSGNSAIRSSNSAAGYAAEGNVEFVTLPAGIYKLTAGIYDSSKTPDSHWKFLAGEQEIADLNCTVVNIQELTSDEFTLTQETKLYIAQGGSASMGIDFIYIVKTGEAIPDGISILKNAAEKGAVYDMQGRKQTGKLRTGLYIMDGKVISVK